ncbi:PepSY-associated TM helix domain-containing protein [Pedobacter agri]|uniref:PepSY-associated TM helix domain-containing protein n=1 Tax=Pedobacter agri TaxID=454586 RepID=UPI00292CE4CB|nr:PepSY-associated TM helix domain-containing protein [Pedobacter agri]
MTFKKINAWLHLWLGLASGIVVFVLGITGCVLVFEVEIKDLTNSWFNAKPASSTQAILKPSILYQAVQSALPGREIESVWYHGENKTAHFRIHEMDSVIYVNPYTAEVVAIVKEHDFFQFFKDGHYYMWLPQKIGHQVTGWGTLIFFLLTISGLILWWPKKWNKRSREQSFKIKWSARFKRLNYDLHNVLGFYSLIVALIFAFTALMMSFAWFNNGVFWLAGGQKTERVKALSDTTKIIPTNVLLQVDRAWTKGVYEIAEHHPFEIILHYPETPSDALYVCTDMYRGTWRDVYLDQYTLKELPASAKRLRDENLAAWIRRSNYGIHVGAIGNLTTKIIFFLVSLICASLPITGFYIWWGKKKKSKNKKVQPAP